MPGSMPFCARSGVGSALRDFETVDALARSIGLTLVRDAAMPANNRTLVWRRSAATAAAMSRAFVKESDGDDDALPERPGALARELRHGARAGAIAGAGARPGGLLRRVKAGGGG